MAGRGDSPFPLFGLPDEVLEIIFNLLPQEDALNARVVSRRMCQAVCAGRRRWTLADLYRSPPLDRVVQLFPHISTLELGESSQDTDLPHLARLRSLRILSLAMCEELTCDGLLTLPNVAPRVERLLMAPTADDEALSTLHTMRHLAALDLGECTQLTEAALPHIARIATLTELTLDFDADLRPDLSPLRALTGLAKLTLCSPADIAVLENMPSLRTLSYMAADNSCLPVLGRLTQLTTLDLGSSADLEGAAVGALLPNLGATLHELGLADCDGITDIRRAAELTQLTALNLDRCFQVEDRDVKAIARLPRLQRLSLYGCERVTAKGLAYVAHVRRVEPPL